MLARVGGLMSRSGASMPAPSLALDFMAINTVADLPAGCTFTRASTATRVNASGVMEEVAANVLRIQHDAAGVRLGLILEDAGTNSVRNPRGEGVVDGTPGTTPTNWTSSPTTGPARTITHGVEGGRDYIDFRWAGTVAASGYLTITPESNVFIAAAVGQTWTYSAWVSLVGGSLSNISNTRLRLQERQAGTAGVVNEVFFTPTSTPTRYSVTKTLTDALTDTIGGSFLFAVTAGTDVDVTVRFSWPQIEQQVAATSMMLPPVGAPAVSTQAREVFTLPTACVDFTKSTMAMRSARAGPGLYPTNKYALNLGITNDRAFFFYPTGLNTSRAQITTASTAVMVRTGTATGMNMTTFAMEWGDGTGSISFDGETAVVDADVVPANPAAPTYMLGGTDATANARTDTVYQFLRVWKGVKLTALQVQQQSGRTT